MSNWLIEHFNTKLKRVAISVYRGMLMTCVFSTSSIAASATDVVNAEVVPRTILAFYDSRLNSDVSNTDVHTSAEMPLNHLGLLVKYHDIHVPLPAQKSMRDVRGILLWVYWDTMPDPNRFLSWIIEQMKAGKRVVIMGSHAFESSRERGVAADSELIRQFWREFGMSTTSEWFSSPLGVQVKSSPDKMTDFERPLSGLLPAFPRKVKTHKAIKSYLKAYRSSTNEMLADLITIGPRGGYVAPGYSLIYDSKYIYRYWYLDPFRFFSAAFATDDLPKADTTTLSGRRIYYSHVDGDGWHSISQVPAYRGKNKSVTEVLLREILQKYPDLPVTVAPVAADLDSRWFGTDDSQRLAREIFALPHVEAGSHTTSHPLEWSFFKHYTINKESPYLNAYPDIAEKNHVHTKLKSLFGYSDKNSKALPDSSLAVKKQKVLKADKQNKVAIPRAYYSGPFNIIDEIQGSMDIIQQYLPPGKKVEILQWSGDCRPYAEAIRQTRLAGVRNINGGDSRLDRDFDSYTWVAPIGREVGDQRQVYASSSNENTYTNLWQSRYYGYAFLEKTLRRTETPWRLKPINIYYHNYSAERLASLNALHKDLAYAQKQLIAPVSASHYAAIADGYFTIKFENIGKRQWRIKNRGQLQTIRFDHATFDAVDFSLSQGVIGQSHLHGSLYVYLDSSASVPVIALKKLEYSNSEPVEGVPYLIDGRWRVKNVKRISDGFHFQVQGFGDGNMHWHIPKPGRYKVLVEMVNNQAKELDLRVGDNHKLTIELLAAPIKPAHIRVTAVH